MLRDNLSNLSEAANRAFLDGDLQTALGLYDEAIQLYPANHILHSNRSAILLRLNRFRDSLVDAELSVVINPKWSKGYLRKGDALRGSGKFDEAILSYCQGMAIENGTEIVNALKDCLLHSSIKDHLSVLLDSTGNDLEDPFLIVSIIGQEYLNIGHIAKAILLLNLAVDVVMTDSVSLELKLSVLGALSFAHYQQKNYCQALKFLAMQLEVSKQLGEVKKQLEIHSNIANIAVLNDERALAIDHLEKQIEIMLEAGEDAEEAQINLCDLYIGLGRYQPAAQTLATIGTTSYRSILQIVKLALAKNDTAAALTYCSRLKKASSTADEEALAIILKCKCLLLRKETTVALSILRSAMTRFDDVEPSPEIIGQYFGILSECHLAVGQCCTARKWAKKELKIATTIASVKLEADALRNLSNVYRTIDDYPNAVVLWYKYCSVICGESVESRLGSLYWLSELCKKCARNEEAEMALLKRLELAQKSGTYAFVIDAHGDLYQFYRALHRKEKANDHLEQAQRVFAEQRVVERQALIIEMKGDNYFDYASFEEAIDAYDRCLMLVQENGPLEKEAKLCTKLGSSYWSLYHTDEALAYYQQSLAVCQQIPDLRSMMDLYSAMAKIHFKKGTMEECHSCLRCYLTLASLLSKNAACLDALIFIGRTLLLQKRYREAKKIFVKALKLAAEGDYRRERGLLHGYIAECYLGAGDKAKASLNFCKQIPFFDDIDDIEGKCETLRHLIEEKRLSKDADWAMRLCKSRVDLSQMGSVDLQVNILKESAEVAASLSEPREACKFLEKAMVLCIVNKCGNVLDLLINLKQKYLKCCAKRRAVMLFRECLDAVDLSERTSILLELGKLELAEGMISNSISHLLEARERTLDKSLKALCEYTLACANYANKNYNDALYHMQNFNNLRSYVPSICADRLEVELALIEWHCSASDRAVETIQDIAMRDNSHSMHKILDESCLYDLLSHEKLSKIAAIHWMMTRGDFLTARHLFDLHKDAYQNMSEYATDLALFYWHDRKFAQCAEFLEKFLSQFSEEDPDEASQELSLIQFRSRQRALLGFLCITLILCKHNVHADTMETVAVAETEFWRNVRKKKQCTDYCTPSIQSTRDRIEKMRKSLLYCLHVDHYVLIWHFSVGHGGKLYYFLDTASATNELPVFYAQFLEQMFSALPNISILSYEKFEELIDKSELLVNVRRDTDAGKTHLVAIHEPPMNVQDRKEPEIGILCAGIDSADISWEYVSCNDRTDFIHKAQASSLVIIDFTKFDIDIDSSFNYNLNVDVVILLHSESDNLASCFRIAGAHCLLDIRRQSFQPLLPFFEKLITGCPLEDCLELLQGIEVRLFGDRTSKVRHWVAQCTRKVIVNAEHGSIHEWISENDQRELDYFRGLPSKVQFHLLDMMKHQLKTNEIQMFVEKLEDVYEQENDSASSECTAPANDEMQNLFVQLTRSEQSDVLQFVKRVFRDHLYGLCDDAPSAGLHDNLDELMQSLAIKVRTTRKKHRRRKCRARGFCSEAENSRRSSMSENTDSEAVVVDVEFQDSE